MDEIGKKHKKYLIIFWAIIIVPIVSVITIFSLIAAGKLGVMPSFEELENPKSIVATSIITADSVEIGTFYYGENRSLINYPDISPYMVDAIIAVEDMRYRKHSGIDFRGLGRVLIKSVLLGQDTGGGSTITQQLAKMLFPREKKKNILKFVIRKFKEWVIAVKLERSYTKEEILAWYLNKFDFLNNAVGVRTAARVYFNISPAELNIEQSAMLAAMHKNPSHWNPLKFEERVLERRNLVLRILLENEYITKGVCDSLATTGLALDYQKVDHKLGPAPSFREYLRFLMTMHPDDNNFEQEEWDKNPLYGWCNKNTKPDGNPYNIYRDGLKIYTTIDSRMQKYAQEAVVEHLRDTLQGQFNRDLRWRKFPPFDNKVTQEEIDASMTNAIRWSERYRVHHKVNKMPEDSVWEIFNTPIENMKVFSWDGYIDTTMTPYDSILYHKSILRGGLMSMVPQNGYVKAYVGSIDFEQFQYDQVNSGKNQVGSIFKPFLYTLAYENGYSPCTEVPNVKVTFNVNVNGVDTTYTPKYSHTQNWDGKWVPLRLGLAKSLNQISAWIMREFNPYAVIDVAKKMGVKSYMYPGYPLCVGSADLKLSEITRAFSTFANKGFYVEPVYVTHIEDKNGNVLESFKTKSEIAISEITAYKMLKTMEGVTQPGIGTGRRLRREPYLFDFPIAGKTGTTNDNSDGWFVGITPDLITGVWTGGEDQHIHFSNTVNGNALGQGANMALPVYALLMQKILADSTINILLGEFEAPEGYNYEMECARILREQARKRSSGIIEDEEF